jgi:hypothetical protein
MDENMDEGEGRDLAAWRIRTHKIGTDVGREGMTDQNIIPLLHQLKSPTFFTYDKDYYQPRLCHKRYCLVFLHIKRTVAAQMIRRFLRHPAFRTWSPRRGTVVRVTTMGMSVWRLKAKKVEQIPW